MAEDQNLNAIVRSLLGLTGSQQPMETNALIRELARRIVLSGFSFDETTGTVLGFDADTVDGYHGSELAALAENETITGNWTHSGTLALNGVTTMGANQLFSADNTHDIGATGATRPRDLHVARNALVGGTLGVTGVGTFTAQSVHSAGVNLSSNGQIVFPASQNASAGANTLDDYEEGTFVPTFGGSGGQSGQVYTIQQGHYVKIGQLVFVQIRLAVSTLGTLTTTVQIKDLPFTVLSTAQASGALSVSYFTGLTSNSVGLSCVPDAGATSASLFTQAAAGTAVAAVVQADLSNTTDIVVGGTYRASA